MKSLTVPLVNLNSQHAPLRRELIEFFEVLLSDGQFIGGDHVAQFEQDFAGFNEVEHCVSLANGTDALWIALRALGIGPGDEVITSAVSFFATAEAITLAGATPVFCDVDADTVMLNPGAFEAAISERTKAVIPVHIYGKAAPMEAILDIAKRRGLAVVEDCAQAAGARYRGQRVGSLGTIGCFSFYPSKNLGAIGDAGAITCNDAELARQCRMIANHGALAKYQHLISGCNSRMDALQAGVLTMKLPHLDGWNSERREIASMYRRLLSPERIEQVQVGDDDSHIYHLFVVRVRNRDRVMDVLRNAGIGVDVHYPAALPMLPMYRDRGFAAVDYPVACRHASMALSLPIYPGMRPAEVEFVAETLNAAAGA